MRKFWAKVEEFITGPKVESITYVDSARYGSQRVDQMANTYKLLPLTNLVPVRNDAGHIVAYEHQTTNQPTNHTETDVMEQPQVDLTGHTTQEVIEMIHKEFFTASEETLRMAQEILAKAATDDVAKGDRLQALGFHSSQKAQETERLRRERDNQNQRARKVKLAGEMFPNHKFIFGHQVQQICKKYNLFLGPTTLFKGDVPEKNLQEIEAFAREYGNKNLPGLVHPNSQNTNLNANIQSGYDMNQGVGYVDPSITYTATGAVLNINLKICAPLGDFYVPHDYYADEYDNSIKECGPYHRRTSADPTKYERLPDPIVLQYIPNLNGYIIVSSWGDEANDPLVKG